MKRLATVVTLFLAACGGSDTTGPNTSIIDIDGGPWQWEANISNDPFAVSCVILGSVTISQSGNQFVGTASNGSGQCTGPGVGSVPITADGDIADGSITGNTVTYDASHCSSTGTATGSPVNRIAGSLTCSFPISGQDVPLTGLWQITR